MSNPVQLIVMAKAPVAGAAKTRLIPALGAAGAAALAERLLRQTVAQAVASGLGPVELCVTPDLDHPVFEELRLRHPAVSLALQADGDIGQRMASALQRHLSGQLQSATPTCACVLLMGTDLPAIDASRLRQAAQALLDHDTVFIPALDGGYGLVGLWQPAPRLFEGIAWSTPQVMHQTLVRLAELGLHTAVLEPAADIDEPADLVHLPAEWLR